MSVACREEHEPAAELSQARLSVLTSRYPRIRDAADILYQEQRLTSQMSQLDLGACFGEADRLDEPMTQEQFLQQTPARCVDTTLVGHSRSGHGPCLSHFASVMVFTTAGASAKPAASTR